MKFSVNWHNYTIAVIVGVVAVGEAVVAIVEAVVVIVVVCMFRGFLKEIIILSG